MALRLYVQWLDGTETGHRKESFRKGVVAVGVAGLGRLTLASQRASSVPYNTMPLNQFEATFHDGSLATLRRLSSFHLSDSHTVTPTFRICSCVFTSTWKMVESGGGPMIGRLVPG